MTAPHGAVHVTALFVYPIKSAEGVFVTRAVLTDRGVADDRRWMLVGADGVAITLRDSPSLRWVQPALTEQSLQVRAPGMPTLTLPREPQGAARLVSVWGQPMDALDVGADASAWFSAFLNRTCQLVFMPDASHRPRAGRPDGVPLAFQDGNPVHLVSEASLGDLNRRLPQPVDARRFRPNVVVSGDLPYSEDYWRHVRIGDVTFDVVESCARCGVVNINDAGGANGTVLRTLASYRRWGRFIPFGQHLNHHQQGPLHVGDAVHVLQRAAHPNPSG